MEDKVNISQRKSLKVITLKLMGQTKKIPIHMPSILIKVVLVTLQPILTIKVSVRLDKVDAHILCLLIRTTIINLTLTTKIQWASNNLKTLIMQNKYETYSDFKLLYINSNI